MWPGLKRAKTGNIPRIGRQGRGRGRIGVREIDIDDDFETGMLNRAQDWNEAMALLRKIRDARNSGCMLVRETEGEGEQEGLQSLYEKRRQS